MSIMKGLKTRAEEIRLFFALLLPGDARCHMITRYKMKAKFLNAG